MANVFIPLYDIFCVMFYIAYGLDYSFFDDGFGIDNGMASF